MCVRACARYERCMFVCVRALLLQVSVCSVRKSVLNVVPTVGASAVRGCSLVITQIVVCFMWTYFFNRICKYVENVFLTKFFVEFQQQRQSHWSSATSVLVMFECAKQKTATLSCVFFTMRQRRQSKNSVQNVQCSIQIRQVPLTFFFLIQSVAKKQL